MTGIALDSRRTAPGELFAALPGTRDHGAAHVAEAVARGASALLVPAGLAASSPLPGLSVAEPRAALSAVSAAFFDHPSRDLAVLGVTGSNGKTTVACMLAQILTAAGAPTGFWTTNGVNSGARRFRPALTTPEAPDLQRFLREVLDAGMRFASMEVSSHSVVQHRIDGVLFRAGVVTTVTPDHLDYHGTFEAYLEAKRGFVRRLPPGALCVHNADDDGACLTAEVAAGCRRLSVGFSRDADLRLEDARITPDESSCGVRVRVPGPDGGIGTTLDGWVLPSDAEGMEAQGGGGPSGAPPHDRNVAVEGVERAEGPDDGITLAVEEGRLPGFTVRVPLPGRHNLINAVLALAVALDLGVPLDVARAALAAFAPPARRLRVRRVAGRTVIDDVAMNEASFDAVLGTVAELAPPRLVTVVALRGNRGSDINARIAATLARWNGRLDFAPLIASLSDDALAHYHLDYRVRPDEVAAFLDTARAKGLPVDIHTGLESAIAEGVRRLGRDGTLLLLGTFGMDEGAALACHLLGADEEGERYPEPTFG